MKMNTLYAGICIYEKKRICLAQRRQDIRGISSFFREEGDQREAQRFVCKPASMARVLSLFFRSILTAAAKVAASIRTGSKGNTDKKGGEMVQRTQKTQRNGK